MNTKNVDVKNDVTQPLDFTFNPQEDITAYELAQLVNMFFAGAPIFKADLPALEEKGLLRHLKSKKLL